MAGTWRLGIAIMVLATVWTMAGRVAEAQLAPLPLTVAIYDYAALPPPVLERAKSVATREELCPLGTSRARVTSVEAALHNVLEAAVAHERS